jgi:hypothetical protein
LSLGLSIVTVDYLELITSLYYIFKVVCRTNIMHTSRVHLSSRVRRVNMLKHPFTMTVARPTQAGKSGWVFRMIEHANHHSRRMRYHIRLVNNNHTAPMACMRSHHHRAHRVLLDPSITNIRSRSGFDSTAYASGNKALTFV